MARRIISAAPTGGGSPTFSFTTDGVRPWLRHIQYRAGNLVCFMDRVYIATCQNVDSNPSDQGVWLPVRHIQVELGD